MLLLRNRDFNYVGTCLAPNGWALIRTRSIFIMGLMVRSSQYGEQNNAKATAVGSECFDPKHSGIQVLRRPFLIP
jgi:hypothetical protein